MRTSVGCRRLVVIVFTAIATTDAFLGAKVCSQRWVKWNIERIDALGRYFGLRRRAANHTGPRDKLNVDEFWLAVHAEAKTSVNRSGRVRRNHRIQSVEERRE